MYEPNRCCNSRDEMSKRQTFGAITQTVQSTIVTVPTCVYKSIRLSHRISDVYTQRNNVWPYSDYRNYDQHRVRMVNDHTKYRNNTQQYMDRFVNKHHNQRQNNAVSSTYQPSD